MRFLLLTVFAAAVVACAGPTSHDEVAPPLCPLKWFSDAQSPGGCRPSNEIADDTRQRLGSGATGFLRVTTGVCGLCAENCSCDSRLVPNAEVRARVGTVTVASSRTSADGVFALKLPPGKYTLVAQDPETASDEERPVEIGRDVTVAPFLFDHAAY